MFTEEILKYQKGGKTKKVLKENIASKQDNTKVVYQPLIPEKVKDNEVMRDLVASGDKKLVDAISKQLLKYGNPDMSYSWSKHIPYGGRYNPLTNEVFINKGFRGKNASGLIAPFIIEELAHAKQVQDQGALKLYGRTAYTNLLQRPFKDVYEEPGNFEYEAHSIISPKIKEEYEKDLYSMTYEEALKDWEEGWDAEDPNRPPKPVKKKSKLDIIKEQYGTKKSVPTKKPTP